MLTPWFIMLMRNFIKSIPFTIIEAAKIDGAGDWRIYMHIVLPMSKAGLATIGLFIALNSVSYTHLDVYKRQVPAWGNRNRRTW